MGSYDYGRGAWVVSGDYAHAWSEVYFPGYGWIEFEPTPSQGIFVRPSSWPDIPAGLGGGKDAEARRTLPPLWVMAIGLAVALLFVIVWPPRWFRRSHIEPREKVWRVYSELVRRAEMKGCRALGIIDHVDFTNVEFVIRHVTKVKDLEDVMEMRILTGVELTHVPPAKMG